MEYKKLFIRIVLSLVGIVSVYATIMTGFNSVLMGALLLMIFGIIYNVRHSKQCVQFYEVANAKFEKSHSTFTAILIFVCFVLIMFAFCYLYLYNDFYGNARSVWLDNAFYAGIADNLNSHGIESSLLISDNSNATPNLYHYFELWFFAMLANIFGISSLSAMILIGLPILLGTALFGAFTMVVDNLKVSLPVAFFLALTILFVTIGFRPLINISKMKTVVVLICWIWFFLNIHSKDYFYLLFPICLAAALYSTAMPGLLIGTGLFIVILYIKFRFFNGKQHNFSSLIAIVLIPLIFTVIFYLLNARGINAEDISLTSVILDYYSVGSNWLGTIEFMLITGAVKLSECAVYIAIIFVISKNFKDSIHRYSDVITLVLSIFSVSALGWSMIYFHLDGEQVYTNVFSPFFQVALFFLLINGLNSSKRYVKYILGVLLIIIICCNVRYVQSDYIYTLNNREYETLKMEMGSDKISVAYIMEPEFYETSLFSRNIYLDIPFDEIRRFNTHYYPICLSVFEIPKPETATELSYYHNTVVNSEFYKYVKSNRLDDSIDIAKLRFIKDRGIDFLIADSKSGWLESVHFPVQKCTEINDDMKRYKVYKLN